MLRVTCRFLLLTLIVGAAVGWASTVPTGAAEAYPVHSTTTQSVSWAAVDSLMSEQKYREAADVVAELREAARSRGDHSEWTKALVTEVQLLVALHGYETAVRFLKDQEWPDDAMSRAILNLFYAHTLITYLDWYAWGIDQREKVESAGEIDLKLWTREEIVTEAQRAYQEVWHQREELGGEPVSVLSEYVIPNTYPAEVRGTLRDAVSYLFVELLANTSNWRPEQWNELYTLDLPVLIRGDLGRSRGTDLTDPGTHPLVKICAILDDLETWNARSHRRAGVLEARLERLRRLWAAYSEAEDRTLIRENLEATLPGFRRIDWWSEGMAQLAEFIRQEDDPNGLVSARAVAEEGYEAYPESVGGRHCLAIVKNIEAPAYSVQAMKTDGVERRSIEINHKNLSALHFRAYHMDLVQWIHSSRDWNLLPAGDEIAKIVAEEVPEAEWQLALPPTPDYREHRTYSTPPIEAHGFYIIVSSARADFTADDNQLLAAPLILTDLVLITWSDGMGGYEVRVVSGETGKPVAGADVSLYQRDWKEGHHTITTMHSDTYGLVRFRSREAVYSGNRFLLARKSGDLTLDDSNLRFYATDEPGDVSASLIYTDRSVYRPTQKVFWKVLAYHGRRDLGRLTTLADRTVTISLLDPNNQTVESRTVTTNSFGSAAGEFTVPPGRPLGHWRLTSSLSGMQAIRVEEYKRPTFEASFRDPAQPLRLNRPATLTGEVRYYFGLPVVNGTVRWRVTREPMYPWWWHWWFQGGGGRGSQTIATGTSVLSEGGTFEVAFTPEADERLAETSKEITYRFVVVADVTDEGGETRSATRGFRLGFVTVEARVTMPAGFVRAGTPAELTISRTSLDGVPKAGVGEWRLYALELPDRTLLPADEPLLTRRPGPATAADDAYHTSGDSLRQRWESRYSPERTMQSWPNGREVESGGATHEETGLATVSFPALQTGAYRMTYTTVDDFGATFETSHEFVVAGPGTILPLPALLRVESSSVPVGGTARLLVTSGLEDQLLFLDIFRSGQVIERRLLVPGTDEALIEIPIGEDDRGGFGITLGAVRDHQFLSFSQAVHVPWDDRRLDVSFATFRDKIRPDSRETWTVTVKGAGGTASEVGAAELLAYMYDKSLDIFASHSPPNPLSLYPNLTGAAWSRASLGYVYGQQFDRSRFAPLPGYPALVGDRLQFYSGYGIGGPGHRGPYFARSAVGGDLIEAEALAEPSSASRSEESDRDDLGIVAKAANGYAELDEVKAHKPTEQPEEVPRSDFAETAFWEPHLLVGPDGAASIEFDVPDAVTAWNVWVHAVTRDLKAGSLHRETKTVKDLMVRPYVPRFLREGDRAEIKVVVNNASDDDITGTLSFDIRDPDTDESLLADFGVAGDAAGDRPFSVDAGGGTTLTYSIAVPRKVGIVAFKVVARSENLSDGELRPLPVLPSRIRLAQSRFVTLRNKDRRVLRFDDLARSDDPSLINEQMVVTVDAQLFYTVLQALPYLVDYPYECTEQTLNRFLSTGIVSTLYEDYPAVARMAEQFSRRETRFETFDQADPNRRMTLEETPWLQTAQGGRDPGYELLNVLDPRIAKADRDASLAKLQKAQTSLGGFPWFPGGPPSPYMTLYIMHGFAKAMEFGVDVPEDLVRKGWEYLARYYRDEIQTMMARDCCWEFLTFLNYVASCYDEVSWTGDMLTMPEREQVLAFCFGHWRDHSPYLKGYLALTLKRMGREGDAHLVWDSVMDAAQTTDQLGTFWAPEDHSWLWYNDTIETHAFALRALTELSPGDPQREGLVQWLLLNKKLNHWKSTKATAEVVYSLTHYLQAEGALGITEDATVTVGNRTVSFTFEPDTYTGKQNQIVILGDQVGPETAEIVVEKESKGFAFASATWHFSTEELPAEERGDFFTVTREYFKRESTGRGFVLKPLKEGTPVAVGDQVEVHISLRSKHRAEYVHLRDPRAAGLEPENLVSRHKWDLGICWYEETRDSGSNFFFESLPVGEYTFKYRLRANMAGTFRVGPATVQSMYAPEFNAYSSGHTLTVVAAD
jgi:uncharacterized protein YfaS (alpha-2-macroglobulin family)